jgi:AGCS family alanine or glycine:cation symporter
MNKFRLLAFFLFVLPLTTWAQEAEKGLDERVNDAFMPVATWWESLVLTTVPIGPMNVPFVLLLLIGGATFFTIYFKFPSVSQFGLALRTVRGKYDAIDHDPNNTSSEDKDGEVSHFQALATAVSGTVGLGNIAGVAVAIAVGGPGATFWMIVCGLIGMSSKFVECTLGVKYRDVDQNGVVYGGPMYYLSRGLQEIGWKQVGKFLGVLFAVLCVGASFGGGNAFQSNQATVQIISMFNLEGGSIGVIIGLILAVLVGIVIIGGIKQIAKVTEKIVPFMAGLYILASLVIIFANIQ